MHAISTSKSKVPMLPSQGITYAKFGTWRDHFSSALTLKGLQVFAALDSTIPTEYPEVKEDEDNEDSLELTNVLTLQWKVTNKYDFAAKSAEAYALLYEAATNNVQIQRVMKKHKGNFPLAFASVSHFVMGNVKSAARAQRKEILEEIRKCGDADAAREVITLVNANNDDLKLLGTDDELKDNDLFEELMDVIKEIPSLNNVYHLARMPDTKIGEWDSLTEYMISIIARDDGTTAAHSSQNDNTTDCISYDEDDHAKQYEDTQKYEQVQEHFKAMSVSPTQPKKEHLYCLMARVATPATPLVASSGMQTLQLPFGGDDGDADADNTLRVGGMVYFANGRFVAGSLEAARYQFIVSIGADGDVLVNKFDEVLMPNQLIRRIQRGHLPLRGKWQPHTEYDKIPGDDFTIEDADAQSRARMQEFAEEINNQRNGAIQTSARGRCRHRRGQRRRR